ncbi:Hemicentin-2, partial [Orchesella cincta]
LVLLSLSVTAVLGDDMKDVKEGEDVILECRFGSHLISRGPTFYWARSNARDKDNVAIEGTPLEQNYEVDYSPNTGKYDLRIRNSTYDRDNGKFECRIKEKGSGQTLHSKTVQLTVLLPPGPPKITPLEPTATEGRSLDLTCSSSGGSPDPLIRWYRNGMPYPLDSIIKFGGSKNSPTSAILSVTPQRDDDGTEYRCVVWNRAMGEGEKLESSISLNVNYYPRVKVGPENPLRVEKGSEAKLTCNVDSKPAVSSVKWTRNGRFSETSFTYNIPSVSIQEQGSYACTADNGLGQSGEADLTLEVLYAPIVSVVPRKEVEDGESVWIKCNVSSNPRPSSIEWIMKDDPSFRQSGDILRIERVTAQNSGIYICKAVNIINPSGQDTTYERTGNASVALMIKHAPGKSHIEPSAPSVVEGSGVTLTCGAKPPGWPIPQYRWWKEGSESTISVGAQLNIATAKAASEGLYFCQPTNEIGTGTVASAELRVYQAPKITQTLQPQVIRRAGDSGFQVTCTAKAKPRPTISWMKDGQLLDPSHKDARSFYKIEAHDVEIKNGAYTVNSTLFFSGDARDHKDRIMASDRGYYACIVENEVKKDESHMYLRVQHRPIFIQQRNWELDRAAFEIGETAYIPCKVQAFPKPEIEWSFNQVMLSGGVGIRPYDKNTSILANDIYVSTLVIQGIQGDDYGEYSCKATNSMGNASSIIILQEKGRPSPPAELRIVESDVNSVLLKWEPGFNGGYEETKHLIQYSGDDGSIREADCLFYNPCNITGLKQQTFYTFRVRAWNPKGESEFSKNLTAMTRIDLSKIPDPLDVKFEPKSRTLVFNVLTQMPMATAKVELQQNGENTWRKYRMLPVFTDKIHHVIEDPKLVEAVRVRLCFEDEETCGNTINADIVSTVPAVAQVGMRVHYVIGAVVSGIVLLLCFALVLLFCCCRKKRVVKKEQYDANRTTTQDAPPPYYTNGMENKGLEKSMDVIEDTLKNFNGQNGYISYNGLHHQPNGNGNHQYNADQNSYSNSNNAGSVDSQDSLWKAPQLVPNDQQHLMTQHHQQQLQQQQQLNHSNLMHQHLHNRNSGNYEHHHVQSTYSTEDYVPYESRNNYVSDPYGPIPKPKRRLDLIGDSPYHELSGLPDPYMDSTSGAGLVGTPGHQDESSIPSRSQQQQQSQQAPPPSATMTFEESLESGYSTPNSRNRRVIREIIV